MMKNLTYLLALLITVGCATDVKTEAETKVAFLNFQKPEENPILSADSTYTFLCPIKNELVQWQKADVFNPAAIVKDNKIHMLFRAEDDPGAILSGRTSRIGLATSEDGLHFEIYPTPVLFPDSGEFLQYDYPGGCEDPRVVVTEEGLYVMAYTAWNQDVARLSIAHSTDLINWEKKGPAFAKANEGKFLDRWSKSGSIITRLEGEDQVVARINGKYWMYWGEQFINLAWSENLYDWYPTLDEDGELAAVIETRPGFFDSNLTECGPPAVITEEGIILLYNGKNSDGDDASPDLPRGTYSVGKLVLDPADPEKVLFRSDTCLLRPTLAHELTGQYASGTTFAEGLVRYQSKWFLYYGTADSYVGVAISE
ncbi:MAG: glycoside hydrolase family 130 protein [Bacteroidota bacterium]|nr:glycoside hydrolase family 130 protein [Bacteroidota bacterium]